MSVNAKEPRLSKSADAYAIKLICIYWIVYAEDT